MAKTEILYFFSISPFLIEHYDNSVKSEKIQKHIMPFYFEPYFTLSLKEIGALSNVHSISTLLSLLQNCSEWTWGKVCHNFMVSL